MNNDQDIWNYLVMKSQYDTMLIDEKQKSAIVWADHWVRIGQRKTENEDIIRQSVALKMNGPKQYIAFERDGVDINGLTVGVHDLLMMALATLKKKERTREIAITITDLEKVITYHQAAVGIEDGARMKMLGKE